jgi:peptidyl-prolyl cis-trans isomerase C
MRAVRIIAPLILTLSLVACKSQGTGDAKKDSKALAEVNGTVITAEEFKKEAEMLPPYLKPLLQSEEGKKKLLDQMINKKIVLNLAIKQGLDKSKEVSDKLDYLRNQLIIQAFVQKKIEQEAKLTDAEMKKFYDENKEKYFKTGDMVRASHILVKTDKEAEDVLSQLKKGAGFEDLAKKYSRDNAAAKGGDLGWFAKGSLDPEFEKVAFSTKEGSYSGIVQTKFGYHIIKVTGKRSAGIRTFEEVKDQIKAHLLPEKQKEVLTKLEEGLRKDVTVTKNEDALKSLEIKPSDDLGAAAAK